VGLKWRGAVRKGADVMKVNQELGVAGRRENRGSFVRAIPQTHILFSKTRIFRDGSVSGTLPMRQIFRTPEALL